MPADRTLPRARAEFDETVIIGEVRAVARTVEERVVAGTVATDNTVWSRPLAAARRPLKGPFLKILEVSPRRRRPISLVVERPRRELARGGQGRHIVSQKLDP